MPPEFVKHLPRRQRDKIFPQISKTPCKKNKNVIYYIGNALMKSAAAETHIQREPGAGKGFVYRSVLFPSEQYGGTAHRAL